LNYCNLRKTTTMNPIAPPQPVTQRPTKSLKALVFGIALMGSVGVSSTAWVPWLIKRDIATLGLEKLGRAVSVADVQFTPWSLTLVLDGVKIAAADGGAPQLQIKRVVVDAAIASLWRGAPVVDAITVEAPQLRLTHLPSGGYDVDDILAHLTKPEPVTPAKPALFALYNLSLTEGAIDFNDQGRAHTLRDLHLAVPFLSTLPSQRDINVSPHLAFVLNGSRFDTTAMGTPFAQTRQTEASFKISGLDIKPYLPYLPSTMPMKLQAALLDVDLKLAFEQTPENRVRLSGTVAAHQLRATTPAGLPLLALEGLTVRLADVRPLEKIVKLEAIELQAPQGILRREANGQLQWPPAVTPTQAKQPPQEANTPPSAWHVELQRFSLTDGALSWTDSSLQPQAKLGLSHLTLQATDVAWPMKEAVPFKGAASLDGAGTASGQLTLSGTASNQAAQVTATVANVPLAAASSYVGVHLLPRLQGQLNAQLGLDWKAQNNELNVSIPKLSLNALALVEGDTSAKSTQAPRSANVLASAQSIELTSTTIALPKQALRIGGVTVKAPTARVERGADQHWMFERWLKAAASPAAAKPPPPWQIAIADISIEGGAVHFIDKAATQPVEFDLTALKLNLKNFSPSSDKTRSLPLPLSLSTNIAAGQQKPGSLAVRGTLALSPLAVQATVDAKRLPVHAGAPYAAGLLNLDLIRADTSYQGQVQFRSTPTGPQLALGGDVTVEDFRANAQVPSAQGQGQTQAPTTGTTAADASNELLSWKALAVRGLAVKLAPNSAPQVDVKETVLSDFFARIILFENGRLNLQSLVGKATKGDAPVADAKPALIHVGPVSLVNGKVFFSDHFVKPNYSADLTELTGRLSAFSTDTSAQTGDMQLADLALRGRAEGSASLEIMGKLNPLANPLALDIQGKVRDLALPPLSTYAIKYAGHGIERGKLSLDVNYRVQPDGQLSATNKLVLHQLSFGDAVQGATASLPVKLAVALLADRNGVIDLDLPLSGSLNDPQFRIAPLIFKIIGNVIGKALTAPFSLLSGLFGGSDGRGADGSVVAFPPGSARLTPEARHSLDNVATALTDRPALHLTVAGAANLEAERDAFQRERLNTLLLAQKGRGADPGATTITDAEYPVLLKELYQRTDMPKPRNLVGLTKDIPAPEMVNLLLANLPATPEAMRQLAAQRGFAVRDYLVTKALPIERLVLGAAKAETAQDKGGPRAELSLGVP
jgi:Domain of Unknown Function (DUF748)